MQTTNKSNNSESDNSESDSKNNNNSNIYNNKRMKKLCQLFLPEKVDAKNIFTSDDFEFLLA